MSRTEEKTRKQKNNIILMQTPITTMVIGQSETNLDWEIKELNPDDLKTNEQQIGGGAYGIVISCSYSISPTHSWKVAKKVIHNIYELKKAYEDSLENELSIWKTLNHKNIVRIIGYCKSPLMIISELMTCNLNSYLEKCKENKLSIPLQDVNWICSQVFCGLRYLHEKDIIHRDLHPKNILMNNNFEVKIADFGESKVENTNTSHTQGKGNNYYTSPQAQAKAKKYNKSRDIWAFGIVASQIILCEPNIVNLTNASIEFAMLKSHVEIADIDNEDCSQILCIQNEGLEIRLYLTIRYNCLSKIKISHSLYPTLIKCFHISERLRGKTSDPEFDLLANYQPQNKTFVSQQYIM